MTTVAQIAKDAFDGVAASITDAVYDGVLNDGATDYAGRVVFGGENAPAGFPMATAKDKTRPVYLEGFAATPGLGWTLTVGANVHYIMSTRDIVEAGGFYVCNAIAQGDLLWKVASLERLTNTPDGSGGFGKAWATIPGGESVNVGIMALSGQERWASERVEAQSTYRAVMPTFAGLTEADRLTVGGVSYQIKFINDVELRGIWQVVDLMKGSAS